MKRTAMIVGIAILWSAFGLSRPAFAELPVVSIELAHGNWGDVYGDRIDNNELPYTRQWMLQMTVQSPCIVTGPRFEFNSSRSFAEFSPYPTSFILPSTYIWDYPDKSLPVNQIPNPVDGGVIASPGFTAVRSVNNPLLLDDVTTQIMDFTLKFEKPFSLSINNVYVCLGTFTENQSIVEESVLSQNNVPGWSNNGDGSWAINPNDIIVGTNYSFQVHIQCTKRPQYSETAIYYKPQAFVLTAEWNNLPDVNGPNTVIIHPEGETAYYQLNESVKWNRSASLNRQDIFLETVSVPLDNSDPEVSAIELYYGKEYNAAGEYIGHSFGIDVEGKNIVAAEVTTPTGRTWAMDVEEDRIEWDDAEFLTITDLTALGIVEGTYNFAFHGLLGSAITTSVNMTFDTPTQSPNITYPHHWDEDINLPLTITWAPIEDTNINTVAVMLENEEEWDFYAELPPGQNSCPALDVPHHDSIYCYVAFANKQTGQTPEGIEWSAYNFTQQNIHFTSGTFRGDFDDDGDVDFYDFATLADQWLMPPGIPSADIAPPPNGDGIVNFLDFAVFAENWLRGI